MPAKKNGPKWLETAVFYEIYPQSFKDTNADGIGDLKGVIDRLDYIKYLGCDAIWLNPCFVSPFGDAGYDIADYYNIAPRYGSNEDMNTLFDEAHKRGMHVLLDLVPGHTSWNHPWFQESAKAEKNEYTDRYIWTDSIWECPEGGLGCIRGISDRQGSAATNFFSHQPALNYGYYKPSRPWQQPMDAPGPQATVEAMKDVMRFWLDMGCDGFRVDMAGSLVKEDVDFKGNIKLWKSFRKFMDEEYPEAALISEWGEPDKSLAGGFHMDFLLQFGPSHYNDLFRCEEPYFSSRGKGSAAAFVETYQKNDASTGHKGLMCIPSGNHDMERLAKYLKGEELKVAFAFLLSMPGAPFIYYGDEIGMNYVEGLTSKEGGYQRTGARTPMQWDETLNGGFSNASKEKLYIPMDPDPDRPDVANQLGEKDSLLQEVRRLIGVRQSHPALQNLGTVEFVKTGYPLVYIRRHAGEQVCVAINPSGKPCDIRLIGKDRQMINITGGEACFDAGKLHLDGTTAAFYTFK